MACALSQKVSPFDANPGTVSPGVHERSQATTAQAGVLGAKLESSNEQVCGMIQQGFATPQENQSACMVEQTQLVAASLVNVGQQMPTQSPNGSPVTSPVRPLPPLEPASPTVDSNSSSNHSNPVTVPATDKAPVPLTPLEGMSLEQIHCIESVQENLKDVWCQWFGAAEH